MKTRNVNVMMGLVTISLCSPAAALALDWDHEDLKYGSDDPDRQWLNIYMADGDEPTPVYLYAHANGGSADVIDPNSVSSIVGAGYSLVSWESFPSIDSQEDIEIGQADAEKMFDWIQENAATYNLDPDRIIVGGRSRGSILSWRLAHSADPTILGVYFYNALPDGAWSDLDAWNPLDDVNAGSPPMYLAFGPAANDGDSHNPANLYPVVDLYEAFDMADMITLTEDMTADGLYPFHFFPAFAAGLDEDGSRTDDSDDVSDSGDRTGCHTAPLPFGAWGLFGLAAVLFRRQRRS
ncbi:MAG: hypothetical protein AAFV53_29300 [Myxococcota bacterium]